MKDIRKDILGYEGLYQVSYSGNVYSLRTGKKVSVYKNKKGYHYVKLSKGGESKNKKVSRLVAIAFIPNPFNLREVNHIKGNKDLNAANELNWSTGEDNIMHCIDNGLNSHIKLTPGKVSVIKAMLDKGISGHKIAMEFGVTRSCISSIKTQRVWANIQKSSQ